MDYIYQDKSYKMETYINENFEKLMQTIYSINNIYEHDDWIDK
jgi:hypothetical protein